MRGQGAAIALWLAPLAAILASCLGPPVLERQVLGYDEVTTTVEPARGVGIPITISK